MAPTCPFCKSGDVQTQLNTTQCLNCGKAFDADGNEVRGADAGTVEAHSRTFGNRGPAIVGNQADVMRHGADVAVESSDPAGEGVVVPEDGVHPVDLDVAKGQVTVETDRQGLTDGVPEPPAPEAPEGKQTTSVDVPGGSPVTIETPSGGFKKGDDARKAEEKAKAKASG